MRRRDGRWLLILAILSFFGTVGAENDGTKYRLVMTVLSADRSEPVQGASIWINATADPKFEGLRRHETTMEDGIAYRAFGFAGTYTIKVSHPEFEDSVQRVTVEKGRPSGDVPVVFKLQRKAGLKVVEITVLEEGTRAPVYDARVTLDGTGYYTATTDSSGKAVINVDQGGAYDVKITHAGFEPVTRSLRVKKYEDEQQQYKLGVEMTPTGESESRTVRVVVKEKTESGGVRPSMAAGVTLANGDTGITGRDGSVELKHRYPPGEQVRVEVEKNGYKTEQATFGVGVRGMGAGREGGLDTTTVTLAREDAGSFNGVWSTDWGDLTLTQTGNSVEGSYGHDKGKVTGKVSGNVMTGKWSEAPSYSEPHDGGDVVFTLTSPTAMEGNGSTAPRVIGGRTGPARRSGDADGRRRRAGRSRV